MICPDCKREIPNDALLCCYCSRVIPLIKNIDEKYRNPYGLWEVTTEGDCEGRSVTKLGVFEGYIDEIARTLNGPSGYSFRFKALSPRERPNPLSGNNKSANISFDIDSKTWDLKAEERAALIAQIFEGRPVEVKPCNYYATVTLEFK